MKAPRDYNRLLESINAPKPLLGESLDSLEAQEVRDTFFDAVHQSFEAEFSEGALAIALCVHRIVSPALRGDLHTDISDELTIMSARRPSPIAFALQTIEYETPVVRFGLVPIHKFGNSALRALKEADKAFSNATFRS